MGGCEKPSLIIGDSYLNADLFYLTKVLIHGEAILAFCGDRRILVVPEMELERVKGETIVDDVRSLEQMGYLGEIKSGKKPFEALATLMTRMIEELNVRQVHVEKNFPVFYADKLRSEGIVVQPQSKMLVPQRRKKTLSEIDSVRKAIRAAERTLGIIENALSNSVVENGILVRDGEPQTSEGLRLTVEIDLIANGFETEEIIISSGKQSGEPHNTGSGEIGGGLPVVVDVFPFSRKKRYFADISRTFSRGKPANEVEKMYRRVLEAQEIAIEMMKPGTDGKLIHETVCRHFEKGGYRTFLDETKTLRNDEPAFLHSTGHGVGLEVHEEPNIGVSTAELLPGDLVTVEPGLYHPILGGVRIEDMILITDDGCEVLTNYHKRMVVD